MNSKSLNSRFFLYSILKYFSQFWNIFLDPFSIFFLDSKIFFSILIFFFWISQFFFSILKDFSRSWKFFFDFKSFFWMAAIGRHKYYSACFFFFFQSHLHDNSLKRNLQLRSSHSMCFIKESVLKNFAKFTGEHLCRRLF